jgi:oligogalacturonide transport system permease protein
MYENKRLGFLFVLPFVLGVLLFKLFPFAMSFALSFTQYDVMDPPVYVGLANYRELALDDPLFRKSLGVTLLFALLAVPLRVGPSPLVAHVLTSHARINFLPLGLLPAPSILGGSIATAVLWRFLFARNGLVNGVLGIFGIEPVPWLADEHYCSGPSCCSSCGSSARPW